MTITSKEMTASTKTSVDGEAIVEIYRLSKGSTHLHYSFLLEFFLLKEDSYREKAELNAEGSIEIDPFLVAHCPDEAELAVSIR